MVARKSPPGNAALQMGAKNLFRNQELPSAKQPPATNDRVVERSSNHNNDNAAVESPVTTTHPPVATLAAVANHPSHQYHLRRHCTERPFVYLPFFEHKASGRQIRYIPPWATRGAEGNAKVCDLCYCYVCDAPVKECRVRFTQTNARVGEGMM